MKKKVVISTSVFGSGPEPLYRTKEEYEVIDGKCWFTADLLTIEITMNEDGSASMEVERYNPCALESDSYSCCLKEGEVKKIFYEFKCDIYSHNIEIVSVED